MRFQRLSIGGRKLPVCMSSLGCVLAGAILVACGVPQQAWASPAATTTTLTVTSGGNAASTVTAGSVVTLTATVTAGGTPTTPGQVNFCDATAKYCTDIHLLGTAQLTANGTATLKFRPGVGSHSYKAILTEPASLVPNASAASPLTVTAATVTAPVATTTYLESSGVPNIFALTATLPGSGNTLPTGMVSFLDTSNGNAVLGTAALTTETGFDFAGSSLLPVGPPNSSNAISNTVLTADFNGDGIPDLVVLGAFISVLLGNGDGTFTAAPNPPVSLPGAIAVGDFNGDGFPDVAVAPIADEGYSEVLLGNGDGTFSTTASFGSANGVVASNSLVAGDFNGDGKLDLAETCDTINDGECSSLLILLGNGDGTFVQSSAIPIPAFGIQSRAVGDFNGDGHLDLAVTDFGGNSVTILLGNGDGTFTAAAASPATGVSPTSIAVADFNGDGHLDLAVTNSGSNNVTILLGNGDGTFKAAASPATGTAPASVAVGDFNGDGIPDLAVANAGSSNVTILLGNGDGTFTAAAGPAADTGSTAISVADFNGDGKEDIVVANSAHSSATALLTETVLAIATVKNVSPAGVGTHLVKAVYSGDANYGGSTSADASLTVAPPGITLTGTPVTIALPGASGTSTITVTPTNGFSGSVTLECSGAGRPGDSNINDVPTCLSIPPLTISGNAPVTTTVTIQTQSGTTPDQYTQDVQATDSSGVAIASTTITITVNAPPAVKLSSTSVVVTAGATATSTLTITPMNGFTGTVTIQCDATSIPAGVNMNDVPSTCMSTPVTVSGNAPVTTTLAIQTQSGTTPTTYILGVGAFNSSGAQVGGAGFTVTVNAPPPTPSFSLTNTPVSVASPGASGTSTITVTPSGGFTGTVTLSCAVTAPSEAVDAPTCSVASHAAITGTSPATATLTVNTQAATTPESYTVTITGNSGTDTATTSVPVSVLIPPSFTLSNTAVTIASPGASGTSTITITPSGGFTGSVALACKISDGPTGAVSAPTCSVAAPEAIAGTSPATATLTVNTQATTSPGSYTVTVTGVSAGISETTSLAVAVPAPVAAPGFTLSNTAVTIASQGVSGTSMITVTPSGGFLGTVTLSCAVTGSPTGAADAPTCSVSAPDAISGNSTVTATLTVNTTAASAASTPANNNIALRNPLRRIFPMGGATLAALLFLAPPVFRRRWNPWLGLLLFAVFAGAAIGCGGSMTTAPAAPTNPGTTAGSYTVTVTGSGGATMATTAVTVTVM